MDVYHSFRPILLLATLLICNNSVAVTAILAPKETEIKEALGEQLFFDQNLSRNRNQSCATCHNPNVAFVDDRQNATDGAVSEGSIEGVLGDRNTPTISYSALIPNFHKTASGDYAGGQFFDGRASDLKTQAGMPLLDSHEMALSGKWEVVLRINENPEYRKTFSSLYGQEVLEDPIALFAAVSESLAAFESTAQFRPFDSRYDRYLAGEYLLTPLEERGRALFFSEKDMNCVLCHSSKRSDVEYKGVLSERELFTDFRYWNIGLPVNVQARTLNDKRDGFVDYGLYQNSSLPNSQATKGRFKTPTLRNIAVTAPYMHNGLFKELRTAVMFYDRRSYEVNPENGQAWDNVEVNQNIAVEEIRHGEAITEDKVEALVAFLKTLTDKRYEHLVYD